MQPLATPASDGTRAGTPTRSAPTTTALARARWRTALLAGALALGATGTAAGDAVRWFGVRGPTCPLGACLGPVWCPGCGLARGTTLALQGRWADAWSAHPATPAVAALLAGALAVHVHILWRRHESAAHRRLRGAGRLALLTFVVVGWLLRLLPLLPRNPLHGCP